MCWRPVQQGRATGEGDHLWFFLDIVIKLANVSANDVRQPTQQL